jgi:hypothetical protein
MKPISAVLMVALMLGTGLAQAAGQEAAGQEHQPLRPESDCIRIDRINDWAVVDDKTVVVRSGPLRYRVNTPSSCPRLGVGNSLRFRASESEKAVGPARICGEVGETVRARDQPPCAIQSVEKIDKSEYDRLYKASKNRGKPH